MNLAKRLFSIVLVLAVTMSILVLPAAAAEQDYDYVPTCMHCHSTNLVYLGLERVDLGVDDNGNPLYMNFRVYRCRECQQITSIDEWYFYN